MELLKASIGELGQRNLSEWSENLQFSFKAVLAMYHLIFEFFILIVPIELKSITNSQPCGTTKL